MLTLLEEIAASDRPLTPTELNRSLGLPKATAHRLCRTLETEGFLGRTLDGRHLAPGPRLRAVAMGILASDTERAARHAVLEGVAIQIGETCNINVPDGDAMLYMDRVETRWPLRTQLTVGSRVPLHCTSSGKLYLGSLPAAARRKMLNSLPLDRRTANTITDAATLANALDVIHEQGYGTDDEEFIDGMASVSVPVTDQRGRLVATLSMHGPTARMPLKAAKAHLPVLREGAAKLSALLDTDPG